MSASEDETQQLDSGWDDAAASEEAVDEAWDSVVPSGSASAPSVAVATEEVDGGWDDVPEPTASHPTATGKRRPHRQRRAKTNAAAPSANPVLRPRPAENNKKQQREHGRKQRAYEAQVKEQRKLERKAERAADARAEAAERVRQAEAAEVARRMREEARERARSERPAPKPRAAAKPSAVKPRTIEAKRDDAKPAVVPKKPGPRAGVIIALVLLALAVMVLLIRN